MLVSQQFGDEIVVANYKSGIYYSLTGSAVDIWLGLKAGHAVDEVAAALKPASLDGSGTVRTFVDSLVAEDLIQELPEPPVRQEWAPLPGTAAVKPSVERFDDLRDLLLLDPVHEVGEQGWPIRPANVA